MKKAIICGYFIGMSLLAYFMFHLGVWVINKDGDIDFGKEKYHMSKSEAYQRGYKDYDRIYWDEWNVKYTFVKKPFGYDIIRDTISLQTFSTSRYE